ncbi:MAG: hypothetical protein IK008_06310 [Bacteroidales bacterium]|nr:hypothetical protein [Bacteroidales bacterium]
MKRVFFILSFILLTFSAGAQQSIALLDKVEGHRVTFHYTYNLSQNGDPFKPVTDGDVTLEGNNYVMEGLGLKVISDGTTRWTLDESAGEAVVENVEKEDIFTNPALFISSYRNYMDRIKVNSQGRDELDVTLTLDENTLARFVLKNISFRFLQGKSDFSVDEKSLGEKYLVTDLR